MMDPRSRCHVEGMFNRSVYCCGHSGHGRMFPVQKAETNVIREVSVRRVRLRQRPGDSTRKDLPCVSGQFPRSQRKKEAEASFLSLPFDLTAGPYFLLVAHHRRKVKAKYR